MTPKEIEKMLVDLQIDERLDFAIENKIIVQGKVHLINKYTGRLLSTKTKGFEKEKIIRVTREK